MIAWDVLAEALHGLDSGLSQPRLPASTIDDHRTRVSIVILTFNELAYTKLCVASVLRHTPQPFELIFVDNGSSDGTAAYLRTVAGAKLVVNTDNLGFAGGNNQGLAIAQGEYIVLLNNDAVVTPGWLDALLAQFELENIGFAGPRSNYVAGAQLVPDIPYTDLDQLDAFAVDRSHTYAGQGHVTGYIVGFCLALRRGLVERIGGLDAQFGSGNFEDNDYCLRALLSGSVGWIADDVFVHHFGHRTFVGAGVDWQMSMKRNGHLFAKKWRLPCDAQTGMPDLQAVPQVLARGFDPHHDYVPLPRRVDFTGGSPPVQRGAAPHATHAGELGPDLQAYQTGVQFLTAGTPARAVPFLERAAELAPAGADFHNALGAAYFDTGRLADASSALRRALALDPTNPDIRANLDEAIHNAAECSAETYSGAQPARVLVVGSYNLGATSTIDHLVQMASEKGTLLVEQRWAALGELAGSAAVAAVTRLALSADCPHREAIRKLLEDVSLDAFDYVVIIEDPVVLTEGFLDRFLALQQQFDFALAQPAIVPASRARLPLAARQLGVIARETSYVQGGPVLSVHRSACAALVIALDNEQAESLIDGTVLAAVVRAGGLKVGIIDTIVADCGIRPALASASHHSIQPHTDLRVINIAPLAA